MQSDRPESGGSDRDGIREKTGLHEREKNEFAAAEQAKAKPAGEKNPAAALERAEEKETPPNE
ncbi:MAG TPA: hypothetical protein VNA89_10720 [Gemmatimonadaceae bacterium]|nr:hypothetical protein [Gemmatimonadaceae bacterium]